MEYKDRIQRLGAAFKADIPAVEFFAANQRRIRRDEIEFSFADGTVATMGYTTVQRDYPKGEFGVYSLVSICGGSIYRIMRETGLDDSESFYGDTVLAGTSHNLIDQGHYPVTSSATVQSVASRIVDDMKRAYVPIIQGFTGDYAAGLEFVLRHQGRHVRNPFTTCVILSGLLGSFERLADVVRLAEKTEGFHDFHARAKDFEHTIVTPVRKWFEEN